MIFLHIQYVSRYNLMERAFGDIRRGSVAPRHEHKLPSLPRVNPHGLSGNWFWWVETVAHRFYWF